MFDFYEKRVDCFKDKAQKTQKAQCTFVHEHFEYFCNAIFGTR